MLLSWDAAQDKNSEPTCMFRSRFPDLGDRSGLDKRIQSKTPGSVSSCVKWGPSLPCPHLEQQEAPGQHWMRKCFGISAVPQVHEADASGFQGPVKVPSTFHSASPGFVLPSSSLLSTSLSRTLVPRTVTVGPLPTQWGCGKMKWNKN